LTAEQRVLIEVKDIDGFEFECPRCNGRVYIPLKRFDGIPDRCPNCREIWFTHLGAPDYVLFHDLLRKIQEVAGMVSPPNFTLRFEILSDEGDE
jgi:phage FluMu protein Com